MKNKKLNTRFLLCLFGSVVVVCISGYFVHGIQVSRNARALLARADRAQELGENDKTAEYLEKYLGFCPTDSDAQIRYGLFLSDPKIAKTPRELYRAMSVLDQVLIREPDRHDLRRRVVRMALDLELFANAKNDLKTHLKPAIPDDGELEEMLGRCEEGTGAYREAREHYDNAIRLAPSAIENYQRLARLIRLHTTDVLRTKETPAKAIKAADEIVDAMVRANSQSALAYLVRAEYRRTFAPNEVANADTDVDRAQELSPDSADVLMAASERAQRKNELEQVRGILKRGCQLHPNDWRFYFGLSRLEMGTGRTNSALEVIREGLVKLPKQIELLWQYAELLINTGNKVEFENVLTRLEQAGVPQADRDCFRARQMMNENRWRDAARLLEKASPTLATRAGPSGSTFAAQTAQQASLLYGRCCEKIGDFDKAAIEYNRATARDPRSSAARIGLAGALASSGRNSEALEQYRQLSRRADAPPMVWVEIARLLLLRNLQQDEATRNWTEIETALSNAEKTPQLSIKALPIRVEMLLARREFDAIQTLINEKYGDQTSRPIEAWIALANLEEQQGRKTAAAALLDEASKQLQDTVELRLARSRFLANRDQPNVGAAITRLADGCEKFNVSDQQRLLNGLATAAAQFGDAALASKLLGRLADEHPNELSCRVALFDVAARSNDLAAMQNGIDAIRRIEGQDGIQWRYARVVYLIATGAKSGISEARSLLTVVASRRPNWSKVVLCQARLDDMEGKTDSALNSYQRVLQLGDRNSYALTRTIELLSERFRYSEAYSLFQRLSQTSESLPKELWRLGAELALQCRDELGATRFAQVAIAEDTTNFREMLWLGRIYLALRKTEKARELCERARDVAPGESDTWVSLVQCLIATGEMQRAQAECEAAKKRLTGQQALVGLAQCYESIGWLDQAKTYFEAALGAAPNDPRTLKIASSFYMRSGQSRAAEPLLRRLMADTSTESPAAAAWARRTLAICLALQGDADRSTEALSLMNSENGAATSSSIPTNDQRTRATLLAMKPSMQSRRGAVQILETLIERRAAAPSDYFLAAQLHEAIGDWPRARQRYLDLLKLFQNESAIHLVGCARSLLRHGDAEEARPLVQRLAVANNQSFLAYELRARLLNAEGRTNEAVATVQAYVRTDKANLLAAATLVEEFKAAAEAELLYRKNAERSSQPNDALELAKYLLRHQRYTESFDICDRVWNEASPLAVADLALAILSEAPQDRRLVERAESRICDSLKKAPDDAGLLTALGTVRNFQGRFDEAEQLYRRALMKDPRMVVALNNLAWLLSFRPGQAAEALDLLRKAEDAGGTDATLLDTRGVALLALKQSDAIERAINDLEASTAELPNPATFFHLAQAYLAAGRRKDASQTLQRARVLGLNANVLHPLELPNYERLSRELK